jgi:PilZ domain
VVKRVVQEVRLAKKPGTPKPARPGQLRQKAAEERRKVQEMDRMLARLEARLSEGTPEAGRGKGGAKSKVKLGGKGSERRTTQRLAADLVLRYRWPGRHAPLVGRVRDISRGGMRFVASRTLAPGLLLQASLHTPGGVGPRADGQMYLEVVHCRKHNDLWDIGARFSPMPAEKFKGTERRRARRFKVGLDLAYRMSGEETSPPRRGQVRDLSRGGVRFYAEKRIRLAAMAAVVVTGAGSPAGGGGTRVRVSALMRVVRCRRVGGRFEVGAQFVG